MTEETIPQMRETIDRLQKDLRAQAAKQEELVATNRSLTAREVARQANFDPKVGELYAKTSDGDLTAEGLTAFATELGLPQLVAEAAEAAAESPAEVEESAPETVGGADLATMSRGGSSQSPGAGSATEEAMTRAEWTELSRTDPVAAREALAKGRVQISRDNPYAPGGNQRPGNPFVQS